MTCSPRRCARGRSTSHCRLAASCGHCSSAAAFCSGTCRSSTGRSARPPLDVVARLLRDPLVLGAALALALVLFSSFGVIVGIYANSWDHTAFVTNIVILPLTFLGGVFYSVSVLPSPWHELSHLNPIFYLINAVRYGFLGTSDVSVALSLAVTGALAAGVVAWSACLFRTGHRLKP